MRRRRGQRGAWVEYLVAQEPSEAFLELPADRQRSVYAGSRNAVLAHLRTTAKPVWSVEAFEAEEELRAANRAAADVARRWLEVDVAERAFREGNLSQVELAAAKIRAEHSDDQLRARLNRLIPAPGMKAPRPGGSAPSHA